MKLSPWTSLIAPVALLLLLLASVVMLPRLDARTGHSSGTAALAPAIVDLPPVVVVADVPAPWSIADAAGPLRNTATRSNAPTQPWQHGRSELDLGMPYYSFGSVSLLQE